MAKKKRTPKGARFVAVPPAPTTPVMHGNVFVTFMKEAQSIGNEVAARRALQDEVGVFLAERGLVDDFEAWRKARAPKPA